MFFHLGREKEKTGKSEAIYLILSEKLAEEADPTGNSQDASRVILLTGKEWLPKEKAGLTVLTMPLKPEALRRAVKRTFAVEGDKMQNMIITVLAGIILAAAIRLRKKQRAWAVKGADSSGEGGDESAAGSGTDPPDKGFPIRNLRRTSCGLCKYHSSVCSTF